MRIVKAAVTALAVVFAALPAGAGDTTTVTITNAAVDATTITVDGLLTLGADATTPLTVSTDPQGDARVPAGGLDLGDSTIHADFSGTTPRLVVQQKVFGGMGEDSPSGLGFSWPIRIDAGGSEPQWLGAGSSNTNFPPSGGWWTGVCTNGADGWLCDSAVPGTVTKEAITWAVPFNIMQARSGRVVSASPAHGGRPNAFVWPSVLVTAGSGSVDTARAPAEYLIPGLVEAGLAPAGAPVGGVTWSGEAPFSHRTGTFQLKVPTPAQPGTYDLWVRSCFGDGYEPTCVLTTQPLTL